MISDEKKQDLPGPRVVDDGSSLDRLLGRPQGKLFELVASFEMKL